MQCIGLLLLRLFFFLVVPAGSHVIRSVLPAGSRWPVVRVRYDWLQWRIQKF